MPTVQSLPPAAAAGYYAPAQMRPSGRWSQQMPRPALMAAPNANGTG